MKSRIQCGLEQVDNPWPLQEHRVKSLSASIIVIAGVACFYIASAFHPGGDTGTFIMAVGTILAAVGLVVWTRTPESPP